MHQELPKPPPILSDSVPYGQLDQLEILIESAYGGLPPPLTDSPRPRRNRKAQEQPLATLPDPGGEVAAAPLPVRPPDQT
jgi:hypothetical protein